MLAQLGGLAFDNSFTEQLPADPSLENRPRQVFRAAFSRVAPTPPAAPELIAHAAEVAEMLDLDTNTVESQDFARVMSGHAVVEGMDPHAACYGGHQFGNWAGQLGDGRAITLGEVVHESRQTLQLKGAGPTPYSRTADGLAVLRSSVREFLCSEAMHHLGVPTTRALSLTLTGDQVLRDMFYDGRAAMEPGAVVCRVAPSFLRFGSYEIFAARDEVDVLRTLADYTIRVHFPELGEPSPETYAAWFGEVAARTARMIIEWQRVGFVHGVMNTDNMSIHGLTIDYGPYGWLEDFDPGWTPNTTDASHRRYRFGNQPAVAQWNLTQLANALYPLVGEVDPLQAGLERYVAEFNAGWQAMMNAKLGIGPVADDAEDNALATDLLNLLQSTQCDMTLFFRGLGEASLDEADTSNGATTALDLFRTWSYEPDTVAGEAEAAVLDWWERYRQRVQMAGTGDPERMKAMHAVNPQYVLRNYLAQLAIDAAEQDRDFSAIAELLDVLRTPYTQQPGKERFAEMRPDWARNRPGCSQLSCSS